MKLRPYIFAAILSALLLGVARGADENEENRYYNAKLGPVYITFNTSLETQYNDNINLSSGGKDPILSDIIITPQLGMVASTELNLHPKEETDKTVLSLTMNLGYQEYLNHPELTQNLTNFNIAPNSQLSFLIRAGGVKIKLYDTFSFENDPVADGSLSNVTEFQRFVNTIGADTQWDINSMTTAHLDVSHRNLIALSLTGVNSSGGATSLSTNEYSSYTDSVSTGVMVKTLSFLDLGMDASAEATTYPSASYQNSTMVSCGPTAVVRLSDYTSVTANAGLTRSDENSASPGNSTGQTTTYGNVSLNNKFNRYYTQTLSVGQTTSLDLLGAQNQVDYVRYEAAWRVNSAITLSAAVLVEDISYIGGVQTTSNYGLLQGDLSTEFRLSRKLTTRLAYRYTNKVADSSDESYKQNMLTWDLTYSF